MFTKIHSYAEFMRKQPFTFALIMNNEPISHVHNHINIAAELISKYSLLLIVIGCVLFATSFLGCIGAITQNTYHLIMVNKLYANRITKWNNWA